MALISKSPATSGDERNLVWHTNDNGATWFPSWTLSVSRVISKGYNKNPRNSFFYDMPHDSVLTVANTMSHETALRVVARDYDGALLD